MINIDFGKETQIFYLNIRLVNVLKLIMVNTFDEKRYEFLIEDYCTASNGRYSLFEIPTYVFENMDKGSYHFQVINADTERKLISGSATVTDSNYLELDSVHLNNLEGLTNEQGSFQANEQVDFGWFD